MGRKKPDPVDVLVGNRIRIERLGRRMSQTALAGQIGVTFQQVQKYEKGVNRVGAGRLTRIARVLDIPVSLLFEGSAALGAGKDGSDSPVELLSTPGAIQLLRAYTQLGRSPVRKSLIDLLESITADEKDRAPAKRGAAA